MAKQQSRSTPPAAAPANPMVLQVPDHAEWQLVADPKVFKSGKPGWWGQARWTIAGAKYMAQVQIVKINGE